MLNPSLSGNVFLFSCYFISWFSFRFLCSCLLFQSVCAGVGSCQQAMGQGEEVQRPLHTSICQNFANTSSPAGLAAKVEPVMEAAAIASTPDGVAGAVWWDLNIQFNMSRGFSLKLSNEKQDVLNCPHSDSQLLWECGFWSMSRVQLLPPLILLLFFVFFCGGVNTIQRGTGILNRTLAGKAFRSRHLYILFDGLETPWRVLVSSLLRAGKVWASLRGWICLWMLECLVQPCPT